MKKSTYIATMGVLTALCLVLGYLESLVPAFFYVPGMKLGLSNILVLYALYRIDWKSAMAVNFIRITISGLLFGSAVSVIYSLAGGMLSTVLMILLKKIRALNIITVSMCGGVTHNLGQIIAATIMMSTAGIMYYMAVLWISGLATGLFVGLLAGIIVKRMPGRKV